MVALSHLRQQMPKIVAFALEVFPLGETTLVCSAKLGIISLTTKFQRSNQIKCFHDYQPVVLLVGPGGGFGGDGGDGGGVVDGVAAEAALGRVVLQADDGVFAQWNQGG